MDRLWKSQYVRDFRAHRFGRSVPSRATQRGVVPGRRGTAPCLNPDFAWIPASDHTGIRDGFEEPLSGAFVDDARRWISSSPNAIGSKIARAMILDACGTAKSSPPSSPITRLLHYAGDLGRHPCRTHLA